jgi:hypothetical protein
MKRAQLGARRWWSTRATALLRRWRAGAATASRGARAGAAGTPGGSARAGAVGVLIERCGTRAIWRRGCEARRVEECCTCSCSR